MRHRPFRTADCFEHIYLRVQNIAIVMRYTLVLFPFVYCVDKRSLLPYNVGGEEGVKWRNSQVENTGK